jgi:hypothetical protein
MRKSPNEGGCWFCWDDDPVNMAFDTEFDTNVHITCLKHALNINPDHPEAKFMEYLIYDTIECLEFTILYFEKIKHIIPEQYQKTIELLRFLDPTNELLKELATN